MEMSEVDISMDRGLCSIGRTLDLVGDRWSMLILREISFYEVSRFERLRTNLGISRAVLTDRLEGLVRHELLERTAYQSPGDRTRHEYRLTEAGRELFPILVAIMRWGDRHRNEGMAPIDLRHRGCGGSVDLELRCSRGHEVDQASVEPVPGPGLKRRLARSGRARSTPAPTPAARG